MGRRRAGAGLSAGELFNEAQRGTASAHLRYAKALWENAAEDTEGTFQLLVHAAKLFMTVPEKNVYQDRLLRFFTAFASEVASQGQLDYLEPLIAQLAELSYAKDPTARWRACQLLQAIIGGLPGDADLADEVADALQEAMLDRLEDGKPGVRAAAVKALARLPDPGEDGDFAGCPVLEAMVELLGSEKSKEVRKAVLATLPAAATTKQHFIDRTRDEADEVRKVTYLAIKDKLPLQWLSQEEQALLLCRGLGDRAKPVAEAAVRMLEAWLEGPCSGEPLVLLHSLGVQEHPEESEMAIKALLAGDKLNAVHLGKLAESDSLALRQDFEAPDAELLSPASALFWRIVCEWLNSEAASKGLAAASTAGAAASVEAAVAGDRLEALEAALPLTVEDMTTIIAKHAQAGPEYRFATSQLMLLAAQCMDFTDATGRSAASTMIQTLLTEVPAVAAEAEQQQLGQGGHRNTWHLALALFLRKVYGSPAELADAMLGVLGTLHGRAGFAGGADGSSAAGPPEAAWLHTLGVAALLLEQLSTARAALVASSPFTLEAALNQLIQPGLRRSSAVRREAARCLGLYCLLADIPTALVTHVRVLRELLISNEAPGVKAIAAQALGDLAAQRGIKELDKLIPAAVTDEAEAEEGTANPCLDPELLRMPLLDLLFNQLTSWVEGFGSGDGKSGRPSGGRGSAAEGDEQEAAALGLALVESLGRLLMCNRFWLQREEQAGHPLAIEEVDVVKALVELLALNFDRRTEGATQLRQALPVFFESYAHQRDRHHMYLATALLPAARRAAAEDAASGKRITASNATSPVIMRFVGTLLQIPVAQPGGHLVVIGHEMLADQLLKEVIKCAQLPVHKPYLATLCKLLPALHFNASQMDLIHDLRVLAEQAKAVLSDKGMVKDMEALREKLGTLDSSPVPTLSEEEIAVLLEAVKTHEADSLLGEYPLPFEEEEAGAAPGPAAPQRVGKTPATKARGRRRAETPSDSSESEEDEEDGESDSDADEQVSGSGSPKAAAAASESAAQRPAAKRSVAARRSRQPTAGEAEGPDDDEDVSSPALLPAHKVQRMRPTPFNKRSGITKADAAPKAQPPAAARCAAQKRGKPDPKSSLVAAAARKSSQEEEDDDEGATLSPVPKPAQKVQRMRPTPFHKKSGEAKTDSTVPESDSEEDEDEEQQQQPASERKNGRRAAAAPVRRNAGRKGRGTKMVVESSSSGSEEEDGEDASEGENASEGRGKLAAQQTSSEVSALRRALSENHL